MSVRRHLAMTLALAAGVGIASAVAFYMIAGYDVEYECRADFKYVKCNVGCNHRDGGEWERHMAVENAEEMLAVVKSDAFRQTVSRALAGTATPMVDAGRIDRLLSSLKAEIVEMPVTNFAVACRLTVSDHSKALLQEIVSLGVKSIQEAIDDENEIGIQKRATSSSRKNSGANDELRCWSKDVAVAMTTRNSPGSARHCA